MMLALLRSLARHGCRVVEMDRARVSLVPPDGRRGGYAPVRAALRAFRAGQSCYGPQRAVCTRADWRRVVSQAQLVHRESGQQLLFNELYTLFEHRHGRTRDFLSLWYTLLEASFRCAYVALNADELPMERAFGFQLDTDALYLSFALLLHDWLPCVDDVVEQSRADATDYSFRLAGARNRLLDHVGGDVLLALRELCGELHLRDALAHGLNADCALVDDALLCFHMNLMHDVLASTRLDRACADDERRALVYLPMFGPLRSLRTALGALEEDESGDALLVDALRVEERHGQLARFCESLVQLRDRCNRAAGSNRMLLDFRRDWHFNAQLYVHAARTVRREAASLASTALRLDRAEKWASALLDAANKNKWGRASQLVSISRLVPQGIALPHGQLKKSDLIFQDLFAYVERENADPRPIPDSSFQR